MLYTYFFYSIMLAMLDVSFTGIIYMCGWGYTCMYISLFAFVCFYIYVCVDVDIHMYKMACIYIIGPSVCKRGRQYQQTFFPANILNLWQRSRDGFMQWEEFLELQQCLVAWYHVFCQHDADRSGFIDSSELYRVIQQLFGNLTLVLLNNNTWQRQSQNEIWLDTHVHICIPLFIRAQTHIWIERVESGRGMERERIGILKKNDAHIYISRVSDPAQHTDNDTEALFSSSSSQQSLYCCLWWFRGPLCPTSILYR